MALSSQPVAAFLERTVKVTLKCGVFQGVLQHVNPDRSLLLRTVKNLETGRSTPGVKMFFDHEIVNVELLDEPDSEKGIAILSECTAAVEGNKQAGTGPADCGPRSSPCVSLESQLKASNSLKYFLSEKKEADDVEYTVVDCFQQKFGPAVLHLKQQYVVSIAGEGINLCRHGKLSWLEVMHDCRWISDCLFHQYGVLLFNVFDTQENPDIWFLRPFPASLLKALALKAMYLLLLHSSLMDNLMSDLTAVVHDYLNVYRTGSGDQLGSTKPTCTELPKELRKLADIQKLRREKAIKDYGINEDGLLIRPALELKERNNPQKDGNYRDNGDCFPTDKAVSEITSFYNQDVLCQEKLENKNQVINLWKNLKPTSSWL
ncbi:piRNA biogenesis protein EXD1 isoform 3-T4 [Chlamydotis macqueenii]